MDSLKTNDSLDNKTADEDNELDPRIQVNKR